MRIPTDTTISRHSGGINATSQFPREWLEEMSDEEIAGVMRRLYRGVRDERKEIELIVALPALAEERNGH